MLVCNLSIQWGIRKKWRPLLRLHEEVLVLVRHMTHWCSLKLTLHYELFLTFSVIHIQSHSVYVCVCVPAIRMWAVHLWQWWHRPLSSCRLCPSTMCQPRVPSWEMLPWMQRGWVEMLNRKYRSQSKLKKQMYMKYLSEIQQDIYHLSCFKHCQM